MANLVEGDTGCMGIGAVFCEAPPQLFPLRVAERGCRRVAQDAVEQPMGQLKAFLDPKPFDFLEERCLGR